MNPKVNLTPDEKQFGKDIIIDFTKNNVPKRSGIVRHILSVAGFTGKVLQGITHFVMAAFTRKNG